VVSSSVIQSSPERSTLAIVVPCYNEEDVLASTIDVLLAKLSDLRSSGDVAADSYILFVDDGSSDNTWEMISESCVKLGACVRGLRLAANVGHQNALLAGLRTVTNKCDVSVSIDADLQDDVDAIDKMINAWQKGAEIVLGVRISRESDTLFKRTTAQFYYKALNAMGVPVVNNHADFRLISNKGLRNLSQVGERKLFFRAMPSMLHDAIATVGYARLPRSAGESKYTLLKMMGLAWDGVSSFSAVPLRLITVLSMVIIFVTLAASIYGLIGYFSGETVSGWLSITLPLYLLGGIIMFSIGIIGEYIAKVFAEIKRRPRYFVDSAINIDGERDFV
jgi:glycosyltransferase involved in cell wall biosynthesis|tara:strand:- start:1647 stop:2651 length:1005 start_codon:yes stop_codon:yes gene_type:complete